ncbi:MAG: hypothetical protein ABIJ91_04015 [Candidatus Kuenenbacteria bacterium]
MMANGDFHELKDSVRESCAPDIDLKMARKGWYVCPQGHSERIKGAEVGKNYTCDICNREYIVL